MINKDYPNSEFIKVQRAAAQCAIDAYEQDEEWCPTKTTRLLEACDRLDVSEASRKELREELKMIIDLLCHPGSFVNAKDIDRAKAVIKANQHGD